MNKFLYFAILLLLFSCNNNHENSVSKHVPKIASSSIISTDSLMPDSYNFNIVPILHNKHYVYFDGTVGSLIFLKENRKFENSIKLLGNELGLVNEMFKHHVANDYFFGLASKEFIVADLTEQKKVGIFPHSFVLAQSIVAFKNGYLISHVMEEEWNVAISYFEFDEELGLINVQQKAIIPFAEDTSFTDISGNLAVMNNTVIYVKEWVGEAFAFDEKFELKHNKQLDFSGNLKLNTRDEDGDIMYNYLQASDISVTPYSLLAVMREIDFEETDDIDLGKVDKSRYRKRIHFFDESLSYQGGLKLDYFATKIHFSGNKLLTLNYANEIFIEHELEK